MKKIVSVSLALLMITTLTGCSGKDSPGGESSSESPVSAVSDASSVSNASNEASKSDDEAPPAASSDIPLQKLSEMRGELAAQTETVKGTEYNNLHLSEDFAISVPETDALYYLTLTKPAADFKSYYEKFDKTFDREFGDIYTPEDKDKLYHVVIDPLGDYNTDDSLLVNYYDKLINGEQEFHGIYVDNDKAYLVMYTFGNGIYGLNHDGIRTRANPDNPPKSVALSFASSYFDLAKNYLNLDSEDRFEILDSELSVKEAAEAAKKVVSENKLSWGGDLEPDVSQVKVYDIGGEKFGFSITMTPSYKGVKFDAFESQNDASSSYRKKEFQHEYDLHAANAFMMEKGEFDAFTGGCAEYSVTEKAEYDSVISFKDAVQMLSDKTGAGMDMSVSRAELIYTGMYSVSEDNSVTAAFPVWKFRCYNETDGFKYIFYLNAVNGEIEYYITDWWDV